MNCECVYVLKEQTMDAAKALARKIHNIGVGECREFYPTAIARITKSLLATSDYEGMDTPEFEILKGSIVVFAGGKYHNMIEIDFPEATLAFPVSMANRMKNDWFENIINIDGIDDIGKLDE